MKRIVGPTRVWGSGSKDVVGHCAKYEAHLIITPKTTQAAPPYHPPKKYQTVISAGQYILF